MADPRIGELVKTPGECHASSMDVRYGLRVLGTVVVHPSEALDRVQQRLDLKRFSADLELDYAPVDNWQRELHSQLGTPWPCAARAGFGDLFRILQGTLPGFPVGHDADPSFAEAIWCIMSHAKPERVVETGVARGISSRFVLEGLAHNGAGHLWSVDMPPLIEEFQGAVGAAVPNGLRDRWTYIRGSSRRKLPSLLSQVAPINLFIQDSVGTRPTVLLELDLAWQALSPGGWLIVNAINRSEAFREFLDHHALGSWSVVCGSGLKSSLRNPGQTVAGQFAIALKDTD